MKRTLIGLLAVAVLLVALGPAAQATDSRSQSLLFNLAIEDQTDVFLFPHLLPNYEGAYFHLSGVDTNIYGGLIMDWDGSALGVFVHRPYGSPFDQYRMPVIGGAVPAFDLFSGDPEIATESYFRGQILDIMYGNRTWGAGLRFYLFSEASERWGLLDATADDQTSFTTEINAGLRLSPGLDARANLAVRNVKDNYTNFIIRAGARYIKPGRDRMRMVFAGELEVAMNSPDGGDSNVGFGLPVKIGMLFSAIPDRLTIGLLGGLDIQFLTLDLSADQFGVAVPNLELAAEFAVFDWLQLRTAIKGGYGILLADGGSADVTPKHEHMTFSSGLGFLLGPFTMDMVAMYDLWDNPFTVIAGNDFVAGISLAYQWGGGAKTKKAETLPAKKTAPVAANTKKEPEKKEAANDKFEGWKP